MTIFGLVLKTALAGICGVFELMFTQTRKQLFQSGVFVLTFKLRRKTQKSVRWPGGVSLTFSLATSINTTCSSKRNTSNSRS